MLENRHVVNFYGADVNSFCYFRKSGMSMGGINISTGKVYRKWTFTIQFSIENVTLALIAFERAIFGKPYGGLAFALFLAE